MSLGIPVTHTIITGYMFILMSTGTTTSFSTHLGMPLVLLLYLYSYPAAATASAQLTAEGRIARAYTRIRVPHQPVAVAWRRCIAAMLLAVLLLGYILMLQSRS